MVPKAQLSSYSNVFPPSTSLRDFLGVFQQKNCHTAQTVCVEEHHIHAQKCEAATMLMLVTR